MRLLGLAAVIALVGCGGDDSPGRRDSGPRDSGGGGMDAARIDGGGGDTDGGGGTDGSVGCGLSTCAPGQICCDGCAPGLEFCDDGPVCPDILCPETDAGPDAGDVDAGPPIGCGIGGDRCPPGQFCCDDCMGGMTCIAGVCPRCRCAMEDEICTTVECCEGLTCIDRGPTQVCARRERCGGAGDPCGLATACCEGFACVAGTCTAEPRRCEVDADCGDPLLACCPGTRTCYDTRCLACCMPRPMP